MFKHLLVPLDGSKLAESALPAAASFAAALKAAVTLFHVIEEHAPEAVHNDHHLTEADEAEAYLKAVAEREFDKDIPVDWHVHTASVKDVAASIAGHAIELDSDLIVMCTHGKGGMRDIIFGSIAQQVIARGAAPVLLLRPGRSGEGEAFNIQRILLPLDSESAHDESFPCATHLAGAFRAELALFTVIPTYGTLTGKQAALGNLLPGTTAALLDIEADTTRGHLQEHLEELQKQGIPASAAIARGDPASEIGAAAKRWKADLLILATHRKAGMDAFWAGSVAPNVARSTQAPLLLLPLK